MVNGHVHGTDLMVLAIVSYARTCLQLFVSIVYLFNMYILHSQVIIFIIFVRLYVHIINELNKLNEPTRELYESSQSWI